MKTPDEHLVQDPRCRKSQADSIRLKIVLLRIIEHSAKVGDLFGVNPATLIFDHSYQVAHLIDIQSSLLGLLTLIFK